MFFFLKGKAISKFSLRGLVASDLMEARFLHGHSVMPLVAVSVSFMFLGSMEAVCMRCSMTRR